MKPPRASPSQPERPRVIGPATWLASFAVATFFGLAVALQRWLAYRGPGRPPSFWDARLIQPQLIPWYAWAALAPLLMLALDRLPLTELRTWRRAALYAGLGVLAIVVQATITGFALGWWWSFPNPVPMDPLWHVSDQLRNRATVSVLVVWIVAAMYHARLRGAPAAAPQPASPQPASPPEPPAAAPAAVQSGPLALRAGDRVWFVDPRTIDWIEADGDYVIVHAGSAHHRVRETISAIERRVPGGLLVRVSRSTIVNLSSIREMQRWFRGNFVIILRDGTRVTTGAKYRDRLIRRI